MLNSVSVNPRHLRRVLRDGRGLAALEFAVEALKRLVKSGARPRAAATVVASLTGTRANDLYKALTGREPRR